MKVIDLRSDTFTQPTQEMREAMYSAVVGDDVWDEDPTVHHLQATAAALFGKEDSLFVPSGCMGNLVCVGAHCTGRGEEVLLGNLCHIHVYEQGNISSLLGVHPRTVPNLPDGTLCLDALEAGIRTDNLHYPITRLICLENTHNKCGGRVLTVAYMQQVHQIAKKHGLKVHVDGARIMNAAVALGVSVADLCKHADSVSACMSKGLGSPTGAVVVGSKDFIQRCKRLRKALGGGMRQAGVLAAPGLISLTKMPARLHEDHANAKMLADGLSRMSSYGVSVEGAVETNIVMFRTTQISAAKLCELLLSTSDAHELTDGRVAQPIEYGKGPEATNGVDNGTGVSVKVMPIHGDVIRAVTYYHISSEDIQLALDKIEGVLKAWVKTK
ncbi:unnamed protein product [Vitrella brassicaformis CCMP3155]|uniref:Aromatic amino acid beta-eliminating lyase/threonine aldolase domain-containing protein n=2 Tax=Vitrella brassicaformis TaxID=1169539 RepID=A0A0G4ERG2_VITBC|nr:unnamed protein product [Vitrella brassicaformis CCMP3155]|mmetsp:Transcript_42695/g.106635  ORF Transcript_42695/g.106635 Transcript_42695/m.106635 type:complete len:384 (+) Transcript_42695:1880-3031(+)|eukprot:CEM00858.1 unnamed protein product [Vitrella brassicaformis CCMP3155]